MRHKLSDFKITYSKPSKTVDVLTDSSSNRRCIECILGLRYCRDAIIEYCILVVVINWCWKNIMSIIIRWGVVCRWIVIITRCIVCIAIILVIIIVIIVVWWSWHWDNNWVIYVELFRFILYAPLGRPQLNFKGEKKKK